MLKMKIIFPLMLLIMTSEAGIFRLKRQTMNAEESEDDYDNVNTQEIPTGEDGLESCQRFSCFKNMKSSTKMEEKVKGAVQICVRSTLKRAADFRERLPCDEISKILRQTLDNPSTKFLKKDNNIQEIHNGDAETFYRRLPRRTKRQAESELESESEIFSESEIEPSSEPSPELEYDTYYEYELETSSEPEYDTSSESSSETSLEPTSSAELEPSSEPEYEPNFDYSTEPESESDLIPFKNSEKLGTMIRYEPDYLEPDSENINSIESEPEPSLLPESSLEPYSELESEPSSERNGEDAETSFELDYQPSSETESEPSSEPDVESSSETEPEPSSKPTFRSEFSEIGSKPNIISVPQERSFGLNTKKSSILDVNSDQKLGSYEIEDDFSEIKIEVDTKNLTGVGQLAFINEMISDILRTIAPGILNYNVVIDGNGLFDVRGVQGFESMQMSSHNPVEYFLNHVINMKMQEYMQECIIEELEFLNDKREFEVYRYKQFVSMAFEDKNDKELKVLNKLIDLCDIRTRDVKTNRAKAFSAGCMEPQIEILCKSQGITPPQDILSEIIKIKPILNETVMSDIIDDAINSTPEPTESTGIDDETLITTTDMSSDTMQEILPKIYTAEELFID